MGAGQSSQSVGRYANDFELVVRANKELEEILERDFGAPDTRGDGLHDKITHARHDGQPVRAPSSPRPGAYS